MTLTTVRRCGTASTSRVSRRRTSRRCCSRRDQVSVHENLALTDLNDDEAKARVPVHHVVLRPLRRAREADLGQLDLRRGVHGYTVCPYSNPVTCSKHLQGTRTVHASAHRPAHAACCLTEGDSMRRAGSDSAARFSLCDSMEPGPTWLTDARA
jgi:hypothetical protein